MWSKRPQPVQELFKELHIGAMSSTGTAEDQPYGLKQTVLDVLPLLRAQYSVLTATRMNVVPCEEQRSAVRGKTVPWHGPRGVAGLVRIQAPPGRPIKLSAGGTRVFTVAAIYILASSCQRCARSWDVGRRIFTTQMAPRDKPT